VSVIYSARGITKYFGANRALDGVDFDVVEGEVNGLIGSNGAGKSTLMKIIAGALAPDAGELTLDGHPVAMKSVWDAAAAGIAIVSQELSLFPALSIEENLLLVPGSGGWRSRRAFTLQAADMLRRLGVDTALDAPLHRLSLADRQLVEIARAMLQKPRVLILDEPTSSLHAAEVERLHQIIRDLRDAGIGIVYVSHFLEDLMEISDKLTVIRNGKRVATDFTHVEDRLTAIIVAMLGEAPEAAGAQRVARPDGHRHSVGATATPTSGTLRISGVRGPADLAIDEMTARPGEITGISGLAGSGVDQLFALLFGRERATAGTVTLPTGVPLPTTTAQAVKAGVAYTPADRKRYGLMLRQTIAENVVSVRSLTLRRDGLLRREARFAEIAAERCRDIGVVAASVDQPVGALSGGNQQKVVFAKWVEAEPSLLLLDDPTRGIDVGAKREMHAIMRRLARSGMVVLFYSSDPGEIAAVADRIFVFVNGALARELTGDALTEHELVTTMNTGTKPTTAESRV
jgi:ABC-type sugar transport system ATPase subunit